MVPGSIIMTHNSGYNLAENNAKLETALETSEKSINAMREQAALKLQSQLKNYKKTYKKQNNTEIIPQDLDS